MMDIPKIDRAHIESWLSAPRYGKYLEASGNNDTVALDLYLWNIGLAQAVLKDVSFFEVALRNAYNKAISSTWSGTDRWLFDDASPVRRPILRKNKRGQVNDANRLNRSSIDHLRNGLRENATIDDVISNLTLGFWAHMTDRGHERAFWIPSIHKAWPKGALRNDVNNRIAVEASAPVDALQRLPVANASRMGVQDQPVHAAAFFLFGAMVAFE